MTRRLFLSLLLLAAGTAFAQTWPAKPLRIIVTFSPGGSSDIVARLIGVPLQSELGEPILIDNRPGAGGTIGALETARAAPDGYTLLLSNSSPISISPAMQDEPRYDPVNYGSGGIGSIGHIVGETLKKDQGLAMEHVGYKGSSPMHNDLLPGTIKLAIDTLPQNVPFIKDGRLKALAVTSSARASMAPDVPSVLEFGHKKLVAENFLGVSGPAGLPRPVIERLHAAVKKSLADPKIAQRLAELGVQGRDMSPEEFTAFVANQVKEWYQPVKDSGAKLN